MAERQDRRRFGDMQRGGDRREVRPKRVDHDRVLLPVLLARQQASRQGRILGRAAAPRCRAGDRHRLERAPIRAHEPFRRRPEERRPVAHEGEGRALRCGPGEVPQRRLDVEVGRRLEHDSSRQHDLVDPPATDGARRTARPSAPSPLGPDAGRRPEACRGRTAPSRDRRRASSPASRDGVPGSLDLSRVGLRLATGREGDGQAGDAARGRHGERREDERGRPERGPRIVGRRRSPREARARRAASVRRSATAPGRPVRRRRPARLARPPSQRRSDPSRRSRPPTPVRSRRSSARSPAGATAPPPCRARAPPRTARWDRSGRSERSSRQAGGHCRRPCGRRQARRARRRSMAPPSRQRAGR